MRYSLAALFLLGCAYKPGSFSHVASDFRGQRTTVGCLDVAVERRADVEAGPVLAYAFANRCDLPTTIDLAGVPVVSRAAVGDTRVRPYDPRRELAPTPLDGRTEAVEALAYAAGERARGGELCVDVGALGRAPSQWLCFGAVSAPAVRATTYVTAGGVL